MNQAEYTALVAQMAHGLLCACASPQFVAKLSARHNNAEVTPLIVAMEARQYADCVLHAKQGKGRR